MMLTRNQLALAGCPTSERKISTKVTKCSSKKLTGTSHAAYPRRALGTSDQDSALARTRISVLKNHLSRHVEIFIEVSCNAYPNRAPLRSDQIGDLVTLKKIFKKKTKGVILTLAGGGGRPPKFRRQNTATRSEDRRGNSEFPAGLAGDRQKAARQPSGKPLPTRMPAPNGAGRVGRVRWVQLHPSRLFVSAMQTLKI
ncbi:hypothetical protein NDU88_003235 [Pleurodeles waltl]|uniref:Uncharacterized protein n=1 Tax=Pleurodeles waltl TaxID=8319 RepID=A0AAV7NK53_PLEWA|nr:hypothetical protein NDU88_003235 [Pleurodeles waltl]